MRKGCGVLEGQSSLLVGRCLGVVVERNALMQERRTEEDSKVVMVKREV